MKLSTKNKKKARGAASSKVTKPEQRAANGALIRQPIERRKFRERLPCKAEPKVVAENNAELATVTLERASLKEERRTAMARFKERDNHLAERATELATAGELQSVFRDVVCVERLIVETKTLETVRTDTGEIIKTRPAEKEDLQETMPGTEPDEPDDDDIPGEGSAGDAASEERPAT